jgi:hypothetical protein
LWKLATTSAALNTLRASEATRNREWSSITFRISTSVASESFQWVMSACHRSLGIAAANRTNEDFGRFWGWGVMKPRRDKIRQIVAGAGDRPWRLLRWTAMVWAPASRPWSMSSLRSTTISSSRASQVRLGLALGRLDRGWSPASPSASKRRQSS